MKKNDLKQRRRRCPVLRKMLNIMKVTTLLFFLALFQVSANSYSQTRLSLKFEKEKLENVFSQIESNSEFSIFYKNALIQNSKAVSGNFENALIFEILDQVLNAENLTFTVKNKLIMIVPKEEAKTETTGQQQKSISGKVTDSSGGTLPGVSVVLKGTTNGTITGGDGKYSISNIPENAILQFSFVGMKAQEIVVGNKTSLNVILVDETIGIEEVVAVGYGTMKKSDVTGSASSLRSDNFNKGSSASLNQLMAGKAAGVRIIQNSNEPGGGISVNIRGAGSVSAGSEPLYVIDGLPIDNTSPVVGTGKNYVTSNTNRSPLNSINPSDIESIEILKDASSTAIYGARGANGVILITTKKGKDGGTKINYSSEFGLQNVAKKLRLLNADEYMNVLNDIIASGGGSANEKVTEIQGNGIDWQDQIFQSNAQIQNHNLSLSGGNSKSNFFVGLNYFDQKGVVKTSGMKRYATRFNLTNKVSEKFNFGVNFSTSYTQDSYAAEGNGFNEISGVIYSALNMDPTISIIDPSTGKYQRSPYITTDSPLAILYGKKATASSYRTYGTIYGDYTITPGLVAKLNVGGDVQTQRRDVYVNRSTVDGLAASGVASVLNGVVSNYLVEGTLTYNKNIGVHHFTFLAGSTTQRFVTNRNSLESSGFPSDAMTSNNVGSGTQSTYNVNSNKISNRLLSYLGRVNYSLMDKYLFTASFRADGSSRFGANNRFGYFPSFGAAWRINQENFFKSVSVINNLKFRGSWGRTGNQSIADYQSFVTYVSGPDGVFNGNKNSTQEPARLPNPDLKWETTEQSNIGFDIGIFNDRLSASVDYFSKRTFDMLLYKPVSTTSGYTSQLTNIGSIKNTGFELTLNSRNINKVFKWNTSFNLATLKNKVLSLGGISEIVAGSAGVLGTQPAIIRPGEALYSFYGYKVIGVWQTNDDYTKTTDAVHPGDLKFLDVNKDGTVNASDRIILGNGFPKLSFGLGNSFIYKQFSLDVQIEGVSGVKMLNNNLVDVYFPVNFRRNKFAVPYLERWTPENPSNTYPSFVTPLSQGQKIINSYTVQDASYIRLQTVTLSYTIPVIKGFIQSGRIYLTGQNLLTLTGYDGMDPAVNPNGNANFRVDFNSYPLSATVLLGVNIDF